MHTPFCLFDRARRVEGWISFSLTLSTLLLLPSASLAGQAPSWHQWRGAEGRGIAENADPPQEWSETKNVAWKIPLPGLGHSTPVVAGNRVFLTTAVPVGHAESDHSALQDPHHDHKEIEGAHNNLDPDQRLQFVVIALRLDDGKELWRKVLAEGVPHESVHETGSWASQSPVTDGKHLIVSFGSAGLFGMTVKGKLLWERQLGEMQIRHGHGEGSSPALHGKVVVVNWDHQGESFLVALDKRSGRERWRVARDEITSWSSPLVVEHNGRTQVVVSATGRSRGYDLQTGEEIWSCGGLSRNVVASPVAADGRVFVMNSYDHRLLQAIDLERAKGDITGTNAVIWATDRDTPYVPSPLLDESRLCYLKHNQALWTCRDAASGQRLYGPARLPLRGMIFSSPIAAGNAVYIADRRGTVAVLERGENFRIVAVNQLDAAFSASPVAVGPNLLIRGEESLYCLRNSQ